VISSRPLAHSANHTGVTHDLEQHLLATAGLAHGFGTAFCSADFARCAGLWHDLGKNASEFQARIGASPDAHVEEAPGSGRVDHSSAGALYARQELPADLASPLAFVIAGHHAGLKDATDVDTRLGEAASAGRLREALKNPARAVPVGPRPVLPPFLSASPGVRIEDLRRRYELWVRMLFSCLVDADFLDTESHFDTRRAEQRGRYPELSELKERFDRYMAEKVSKAGGSAVNGVRRRVLDSCRAKGRGCPQGVFTLTAPTGCGKTLAAMAFALEHAAARGLRRVIVILPYTSIIDQNAKVYREAFGGEGVLEHHASIDLDDPTRENTRTRLARENWDAPVVVTTSVQFLESLLANKPSRCRKLHNVARSVVIFDEVQTLPLPHLLPVVDVLKELVRAYGVTLVLSTATQPALKQRTDSSGRVSPGFEGMTELVDGVAETFSELRRVQLTWPADLRRAVSWEELAREAGREEEVLVIVHRRPDARELAGLIPGCVYLSALMCPAHRLKVIEEIRHSLEANRARRARGEPAMPVRVVATQLVEAGVDIDFPVVYRALGGLDAIAQAAGRCNREGRLEKGQVRVFVAPTDPPRGTPFSGKQVAETMLAGKPDLDPLEPGVFDEYFRRLYSGRLLDEQGIQSLRQALKFASVAKAFNLIEDDGSDPVVVPYGSAEGRLAELRDYGPSRERLRALQPFVVTLYPGQVEQLQRIGALETVHGIILAVQTPHYRHLYDERFGLDLTRPLAADPATLCS
jgi:CRISPR-associated endonuclease/helicase Cas3